MKMFFMAFLALAAVFPGAGCSRQKQAPISQEGPKSPGTSLYEAHDRPTTVFLRGVDMATGRLENIPAAIRLSKSRLNQLKQAVLAYLGGPRQGNLQVPVPPGMELNEVYWMPDNTVVVDVSVSQVKLGETGFWEEELFVKGLIETVSKNFYEVKQVKLLVNGQDAPTLAGHYALGTSENFGSPNAAHPPAASKNL